ncbi:MAG TPA: insulinase family protein [Terriglobales bacterium]|nr:insulinase family protein [Terriglobales bacterium]
MFKNAKKSKFIFLLIFLILFVTSAGWAQKSYKDLKYPPLGQLKIPEVKREVLPNGMIVFLAEDHQLPIIGLSAKIRTGSVFEPADKIGLASITGMVMRTGGAGSRTGDQIDDELERLGASVETYIGGTEGGASMSVLKEDVDKGLSILADILMNPKFDQDKIDLAKVQQKSVISRRNDQVGEIADREFNKLIYGAQSPYARVPEYTTIDNISRDDLVAFHKKYFHPNYTIIGVWGDFNTRDMLQKIKKAFANWKPEKVQGLEFPKVDYKYHSSVNLVKKDDVNQTNIYLGHIGGLMNDPDYPAISLMNMIFGGSFASRLFVKVRSEEGLAYHVSGSYNFDFAYPDAFYVLCQTKTESTVKAIKYMVEETKKLTQEEVTDEELNRAKEYYLNSFAFKFDTKDKVVNRMMTYEYYGFPPDFTQTTRDKIEKVTKADILRAAKSHLHPDQLVILAVGKSQDFDQPLSVLGKVDTLDITIPEASPQEKEKTPEATPASLTKGKETFDKVVAVCGGKKNFLAIKSAVIKTETSVSTPQGDMQLSSTSSQILPNKVAQELTTPGGAFTIVFDGEKGWFVGPQGTQDLPPSQVQETKGDLFRSFINLFQAENLKVQDLGTEESDGKKLVVLLISDLSGNQLKMYVDQTSFLPYKISYRGQGMMGPSDFEEIMSDFREVSGVKLPFDQVINMEGKKYAETKTLEMNFNTAVDPSMFIKK